MGQAGDGVKQNFRFGFGGKAAAQAVEDKAERAFGIGRADRVVKLFPAQEKINQMAVVCKQPIFAPISRMKGWVFANEVWPCEALRIWAITFSGFDLVGTHQVGNRRVGAGFVVMKQAHAFAFEKADTEAVCMVVGNAAATAEAFKRKHDVCGVLQFMPSSWHMALTFIFGVFMGLLWCIGRAVSICRGVICL